METNTDIKTLRAADIRPGMTIQVLRYDGAVLADSRHRHGRDCRCAPFQVQAVRQDSKHTVDVFGPWDGSFLTFTPDTMMRIAG